MAATKKTRVDVAWQRKVAAFGLFSALFTVPFCFRTPSLLWGAAAALVVSGVLLRRVAGWFVRPFRAEPRGLTIGKRHYPRASLKMGWFVPRSTSRPPLAVVVMGSTRVTVEVDDEAEARAILSQLGLDVDQHTASFDVMAPPRGRAAIIRNSAPALAVLAFVLALIFQSTAILAVAVASTFAMAAAALAAARARVAIGSDGILSTTILDREFVAWNDVSDVIEEGNEIVVVGRGRRLSIRTSTSTRSDVPDEDRAALLARIRAAKAAHSQTPETSVGQWLERGDRSIREWLTALEATMKGDYRSIAPPLDDLARVLEHHPSPWARLAAAVLLAKNEAERPRVRVAAEACAQPRLRVALEAAAEGGDMAAVEAAATELEREEVDGARDAAAPERPDRIALTVAEPRASQSTPRGDRSF